MKIIFFGILLPIFTWAAPADHVSSTGAVFARDYSHPALGEAYRDPSGVIWGEVVSRFGQYAFMHMDEAIQYCSIGGAVLPTDSDFYNLAVYLGYGSAQGYDPFLADGKTCVLSQEPWSHQHMGGEHWLISGSGNTFDSQLGTFNGTLYYGGGMFRCVVHTAK